MFSYSRLLNTNQLGVCSISPVVVYPITCIYVNYLAEGSSHDHRPVRSCIDIYTLLGTLHIHNQ